MEFEANYLAKRSALLPGVDISFLDISSGKEGSPKLWLILFSSYHNDLLPLGRESTLILMPI